MSANLEIARTVATHLLATEQAIDAAIAHAAGLVGYMPTARQQAKVSAEVGQDAFEEAIATMSMLGAARGRIINAHRALVVSGEQARIPARNFGGFVDKPCHRAEGGLRVVAERQSA